MTIFKGNYYQNIVATCYVGSNLVLSRITAFINNTDISYSITTINQIEKVMICLKFIHITSNADNAISRSNNIHKCFVTDKTISFTPRDETFDMANEITTIYANNFQLS